MSQIDVLALGEVLADLLSEEIVPSLAKARSFRIHAGGSPANLCANLNWLGALTVMVSCVGQDGLGDFLIQALEKNKVDTRHIKALQQYPTSIVMVGRSTGTPDFIAYRGADYHIGEVSDDVIKQTKIIHTTSFALSKEPARKNILNAFQVALNHGIVTSVDWNFAPTIWTDGGGNDVWKSLIETRPLIKISQDDIDRFHGLRLSVDEAKTWLGNVNARAICLTCGKDGVWFKGDGAEQWVHYPAKKVEEVKDTTGAGDAFWSGFLYQFLKEKPGNECVLHGLDIAAQKIQKVGPLYEV